MTDKQNAETRVSAGERLKQLREEKALSIADVASRLYLQTSTIEALEQDDRSNLPNETYVRGYLQNYAKILNAPADAILALYNADLTGEPEVISEAEPEIEPVRENKPASVLFYLLCLGIFISILLLFIWWRTPSIVEPAAPPVQTTDNGLQESNELPPQLPEPITIVEHPDTPFYRAPVAEEVVGAEEVTEDTSPLYDRDVDGENLITTGNGPDSIRVVLEDDSWIEVFDVNNEKVFYDLGRAGQTLVLNGTAPFSVLVGRPERMTIEFNGVIFDPTPHASRVGIARFVLGE